MGRICDACLDGDRQGWELHGCGDKSDGPTSTGEGAEGTTRTRTADSDGGATSERESSSSRLISVGGSFDVVGG
jgi:hypothetical protein